MRERFPVGYRRAIGCFVPPTASNHSCYEGKTALSFQPISWFSGTYIPSGALFHDDPYRSLRTGGAKVLFGAGHTIVIYSHHLQPSSISVSTAVHWGEKYSLSLTLPWLVWVTEIISVRLFTDPHGSPRGGHGGSQEAGEDWERWAVTLEPLEHNEEGNDGNEITWFLKTFFYILKAAVQIPGATMLFSPSKEADKTRLQAEHLP